MVLKSTLKSLPSIDGLIKLLQSLAMLDAIISPDWEYRYYSFNSKWGKDEMMASMCNGSGDSYLILFNSIGAIMKGFAHESPMSPYSSGTYKVWNGVLNDVPNEFQSFLSEPAFSIEETTFCIWRKQTDSSWQVGKISYPKGEDPDGSEEMLYVFDNNPLTYREFAEEYYESKLSLRAIEHIYNHKVLTCDVITALNPDSLEDDLQQEIEEIGYPNV